MNTAPQDPAPTLSDVWRLFRETDRKFQETERLLKAQSLETDRKFQETERLLKEQAEEMRYLLKEQSQATERQLKEYARAAEQRAKVLDKQLGELGNRLGEFVEGLVAPGAVRLFQARGIPVNGLNRDMERSNEALGLATQIDLFAINGDCCVVIEVKSKLKIDDVNEHLERMEKFKSLFPEYADKKAFGAVAAMVIPKEVAKYAYRQGFFVITQQGESVVMLNDDKFVPAAW
jgi:hypothetical protein